MGLILPIVAVAVLIGALRGGSPRNFPSVEVRWWWLAAAGVVLQFAPAPDGLEVAALLVSIVALVIFAAANIRAPGFILILVGLALNLVVIASNRGMPVTEAAIVRSGQEDSLPALERGEPRKHRLVGENTRLLPLADVIAIPPPVGAVVSVGDLALYLGIGWFVVLGMRPREVQALSAVAARIT